MIKKCCDNCIYFDNGWCIYYEGTINNKDLCNYWKMNERLIREDEREKVLNEKIRIWCDDLIVHFENKEYTIEEIIDLIEDIDDEELTWRENH